MRETNIIKKKTSKKGGRDYAPCDASVNGYGIGGT